MFHYELLLERPPVDANVLNNLGLLYRNFGMPIRATDAHRKSVHEGNTLAGANLANAYVGAGFAKEARDLLTEMMKRPEFHSNVVSSLAAIDAKIEREGELRTEIVSRISKERIFFAGMGSAILTSREQVDVSGTWTFPFGDVTMSVSGGRLSGRGEREVVDSSVFSPQASTRIEKYRVMGQVKGRTGTIEIAVNSGISAIYGTGNEIKTGYVIFAEDGNDGEVLVLTPKLEKFHIQRSASASLPQE
jgi:hypothetical protein